MNFKLESHKTFKMGTFDVNSWIRNQTKEVNNSNSNEIVCIQDINTFAGKCSSTSFQLDQIKDFFKSVNVELDTIIALYYPLTIEKKS